MVRSETGRAPGPAPGRVIVVAGPDGSGKSLVTRRLIDSAASDRPVIHIHHRPRVLPGLTVHDGPVTDPHRARPYSRGVSRLKLVYIFLDHVLGWSLQVVPARRKGGTVVIERGWWDLLIDPHRYRLRPHPRLVRSLGRLLPRPDHTIVLDAPVDVLLARKTELPATELERQRRAWHALAAEVRGVTLWDATRAVADVVSFVGGGGAAAVPGTWVGLPTSREPRWVLPRSPTRATRDGLRIHRPVSPRAMAAWGAAYLAATAGLVGLRRRIQPDRSVLERVAHLVPSGGTVATARSNHAGRSLVLIFDRFGAIDAVVKVSSSPAGDEQLAREAASILEFAPLLEPPLSAPAIRRVEDGLLSYEPIEWRLDPVPWRLDPTVAAALGRLHAARRDPDGTGVAHGDVAPWNLLRTRTGWSLVDWEAAGPGHEPFYDLFHFLIQGHALLHHPTQDAIVAGLDGRGWVGGCLTAYAAAANVDMVTAEPLLRRYLHATMPPAGSPRRDARLGAAARRNLLRRLTAEDEPSGTPTTGGPPRTAARLDPDGLPSSVDRPTPESTSGERRGTPQVTVVISTYNRCAMLRAALASALSQRDVDVEVIVVDNGSTDDTREFLAGCADPRLRVLRNEVSLGSVGGRNTGLAAATSDWVGLLDDDDLWAPDKLRAQLDAARATGRHWVYTGCVHLDRHDRILGGRRPPTPEQVMRQLPYRFVLPGGMSNTIWRRGTLDGDGLLDPRLPFPADWDVSLRLARRGPPAAVHRPLVAYRQHGGNMSRNSARFQQELVLLERKRADIAAGRPIDWGAQHRFVGTEELRAGSRVPALRAFARAVAAGDVGSVPRAAGVFLPAPTQRWLRRTLLSEAAWLREAERWLQGRDEGD